MAYNKYNNIINKIRKRSRRYQSMTDVQLASMTTKFNEQLRTGIKPDDILPDAFAVTAEAARRVLGMYPYKVQFMAGISLFKGNVAQMKTGEGKTLVAALPSYLFALSGKGVHVVTCNDYLAQRDADEIGQIHRFLGLSVGCVTHDMQREMRKKEYACDITYVTNSELGFDYLRDNLVTDKKDTVLRGLHYCIIDEADSILIDEARTPLVISGSGNKGTDMYIAADRFVQTLVKGDLSGNDTKIAKMNGSFRETTGDFIVDEELQQVALTGAGIRKAETFFRIGNLAAQENLPIMHFIDMALKANYLMKRDADYIVDNGEVKIVDKFTGRVLGGRRYSDGLHQALEAKENVDILAESKTYATITYQSFFNKYDTKCGMTGTAGDDKAEINEVYHMKVDVIPTNKKVIRKDRKDLLFLTKAAKYRALVNEVLNTYRNTKQPILIGTASVEESEMLSGRLRIIGVPHQVLNAKMHAQEAAIIAKAGLFGAVTIATNMAGRGTDIKLDESARAAGGLKVIGTERFESRRIDDQLIGRAGRQGDPGESIFYLSLEDDLFSTYGDKKIATMIRKKAKQPNTPVRGRYTSFIRHAQKNIEGSNYQLRKNVAEYDNVLNVQRDLIYDERNRIMDEKDLLSFLIQIFNKTAHYAAFSLRSGKNAYKDLYKEFSSIVPVSYGAEALKGLSKGQLEKRFLHDMISICRKAVQNEPYKNPAYMDSLIRQTVLKVIDSRWVIHLSAMDQLRQGVALQAYAQTDPQNVYAMYAYDMFDEMLAYDRILITKTMMQILSKSANNPQFAKMKNNEKRMAV